MTVDQSAKKTRKDEGERSGGMARLRNIGINSNAKRNDQMVIQRYRETNIRIEANDETVRLHKLHYGKWRNGETIQITLWQMTKR